MLYSSVMQTRHCNAELPVSWLRIHLHVPLMCSLLSNILLMMSFFLFFSWFIQALCLFHNLLWKLSASIWMQIHVQGTSLRKHFVQFTMQMRHLRNICTLLIAQCKMHNVCTLQWLLITCVESIPPTYYV